jgi:succinate dehydrogenase / fumarate reductase flavoprotein subunit
MPDHDVLVVGGGFSGMRAAIAAKTAGVDVALMSKVYPLRSHSSGAHSGINAALGSGDSWQSHANDTIKASDYLADQDAVGVLCQEGIDDVIRLEHLGVIFSRNGQGSIDVMPFPGSSSSRTCYVGDSAGHIILQVLYEQLLRRQVQTYNEWFVTSLLVEDGKCRGVMAQELSSGRLQPLYAKAVILATGGLGRMYQPSTSAFTATADGVALAYRAGVPLMDMEMVQYHPTTLKGRGLVVTEAARGQGAHLVNKDGHRFMSSYAPETGELAPRDLCSRAVATEIGAGRGDEGCVFLDFQHLDGARMDDLLPETQLLVKRLTGIDPKKQLVPVQPAMHRPIGGIQVDVQGSTGVAGLYAAGECACVGVHGANRLGGNSLLEFAVFGRRAGETAAAYAKTASLDKGSQSLVLDEEKRLQEIGTRTGGEDSIGSVRGELAATMHEKVGVYRDGRGLREALDKVNELRARYGRVAVTSTEGAYNPSLSSLVELGNMLDVAQVIVASALAREESRGAHYRTDFPERDDTNWLQHTIASYGPEAPVLNHKAVVITQWQPQRRAY